MEIKHWYGLVNLFTWILLFIGVYKLLGTGVTLIGIALLISYFVVKAQELTKENEE